MTPARGLVVGVVASGLMLAGQGCYHTRIDLTLLVEQVDPMRGEAGARSAEGGQDGEGGNGGQGAAESLPAEAGAGGASAPDCDEAQVECCSDAACPDNFACIDGTCSTDTCQAGFNGPCGGVCTKGCCSVNDCPERENMGRGCDGSHQCFYECKFNWGDCDGNEGNGCEVDLVAGVLSGAQVKHCGECGHTCDFHNQEGSAPGCDTLANSCQYAECWASFKNIGDATDASAYGCPQDRPHAALQRGDCDIGCVYDCEPNYSDCNGSASDGCETNDESCERNPFWGGVF